MIMELVDIKKSYASGKHSDLTILEQLSFKVEEPKKIAIVGKSGSGKSTFLSLACGLDDPTSGQISLLGERVDLMNENQRALFRAKNIGIIFQQFHLMSNLNALENIMLPLEITKDSSSEKIKQLALDSLEKVGLKDRWDHFPHELSGGEKQRVAIARAIVSKPKLIFADEPSGNLDSETGKIVMEQMFDLVNNLGSTLILVTHDEDLSKKCDEVYRLSNKKLEQ